MTTATQSDRSSGGNRDLSARRIFHVINSLNLGGAERLVVNLSALMREAGHDCRIITLSASSGPVVEHAERLGVPIVQVSQSRFDPRIPHRISRTTSHGDILHAHLFPSSWWVAVASGKRAKIMTEHSTGNRRREIPEIRRLEGAVYARFRRIISISDGVDASTRNHFGADTPSTVIYNGIDLNQFGKEPPVSRDPISPLQVVIVGTLDDRKRVDRAIEAVAALSNVQLTVIGDGPLRAKLEERSTQLKASVTFLGARRDIADQVLNAHVFLSTSEREGFGIAALEAMASRVPVIAPAIPGLSEVVGDAGILYPPGTGAALRAAIEQLRDDEHLRQELASRSLQRAKSFSINATAAAYIDLYESEVFK